MVGDNLYGTGGQPFRFWGLGHGDLGFTWLGTTLMRFGDSSLGFGGWDNVTFSAAFFTCFSRQLFSAVFLAPPTSHHQFRSISHVCQFKERHHSHPPHTISGGASGMCASSRHVISPPPHHQLRSISHVCKFKERHHIWSYRRSRFGVTSDLTLEVQVTPRPLR